MDKRLVRAFACITLILIFSLSFLSAAESDPWYLGKRIASFTNTGLQNVPENTVLDIQFKYAGKNFTDELFNELQGELYGLEYFSYFLAEAQRTGEGGNELQIDMSFYEMNYIKSVVVTGNDGIKLKDITEKLIAKEGTFLDDQNIELSKMAVLELYKEKGYAICMRCYEVDEAQNTTVNIVIIDEGRQKRIGEIRLRDIRTVADLVETADSSRSANFNPANYNPLTSESDTAKLLLLPEPGLCRCSDYRVSEREYSASEDESRPDKRWLSPLRRRQVGIWANWKVEQSYRDCTDEHFPEPVSMGVGTVLDVARDRRKDNCRYDL